MNFVIAGIASAAIVLAAPFMGQLQSFLRRSLSTRAYVLLFGIGVLAVIVGAIVMAVTRIRERPASAAGFGGPSRALRFTVLLASLLIGGGYLWLNATPYPEINAVERVHFVEYGLIALLFYRAYRHAGDVSIVVLPVLAAFTIGTLDEWLQWFIPVRVGEARDVFLNLVSIVCGVMFAIALQPPASWSWTPHSETPRRIALTAVIVWLVFAMFVGQVHLGYEHDVAGVGRFRSHYAIVELLELQKQRRDAWDADPPRVLRRLSREDQYLDEGIWHIRRRNLADPVEAWHENLILERFFAPVLDIPTYATPEVNRWLIEQRRNMEAAAAGDRGPFVSTAEPYPIVAWPKSRYWSIVSAIAVLLLLYGWRRRAASSSY